MNPREKRALDAKRTDGKKPRSEETNAALQNKLLHGTLPMYFEALIRRTVTEEIGRTISKMASQGRIPVLQITGSPARKFHLQFKTNPDARIFTKTPLAAEQDATICVLLTDANTGQPVTTGLEAVAKLEVIPLMGDFHTSEEQEWTAEEFERQVAKAREGRGPLLVGDLNVHLKNGEGTLGQMYFTDNSSFTRSKMFRLGVRVAQDNEYGIMSVREGKSEAFSVIDSRGKAYKKHDTPSPTDDVWRLQNIRRGGPFDRKLRQIGINTVQDFLLRLETTPELVKGVLSKMPERAYQETIDHAKRCKLGYIYPVDERSPYESLIFNREYQIVGAVAEGQFVDLEMVDDGTEKVHFDRLLKNAYDHWDTNVTECALEDLAEPSMMAPPGAVDGPLGDDMVDVAAATEEAVDGSLADDVVDFADVVDVAAAPQEGVYGSLGTEGVPSLEPITGQDNGIECSFEMSEDREWLNSIIADEVQQVISEESGEPLEPSPPLDRWWLRIRSVVRCALFIRRAGLVARSL